MAASRSSLPKSFPNFLAHGVANERGFHPSTQYVAPLLADSSIWGLQSKGPLPIRNHVGRGFHALQFSHYCCTLSASHSFIGSNVCHSMRSLQIQTRRKHSESSNASSPPSSGTSKATQTDKNGSPPSDQSSSPTSSPPLTKQNRNPKRRKATFSALRQIATSHPKNSTYPLTHATLTRKQLLRLTQKQRATLELQRIQHHKQSITYLDRARSNVRSNLKYLKGAAESNLKKNIHTIQRLFRGEEVWKDDETISDRPPSRSDAVGSARSNNPDALRWDRLPDALRTNLRTNLSALQNWLHKVTDGIIPSSSSSSRVADAGGSIAIRLHKFHQAKQNQGPVMDNRWIAWNVGLALLPGLMVHLYCLSRQDEMKEFYAMMEEREREKILGVRAAAGAAGGDGDGNGGKVDGRDGKMGSKNGVDVNGVGGGMGVSSALITEGGDALDKIKMAVNDLFLGGVDEKLKLTKEAAAPVNLNVKKSISLDALTSEKSSPDNSTANPTISDYDAKETVPVNAKDVTIESLLRRIQELEKHVGTNSDKETNLSSKEQQPLPHHVQYQIDRIKQSPVQNRRDDFRLAQWRKQEEEMTQVEENSSKKIDLQSIADVAKRWMHIDNNLTLEWVNEKMSELAGKVTIILGNYVNEKLNSQNISDADNSNASCNPVMLSDYNTQSNKLCDGKIASEDLPIHQTAHDAPAENPSGIPYKSVVLANDKTEGRLSRWWSKLSWRRKKDSNQVNRPSHDSDESIK